MEDTPAIAAARRTYVKAAEAFEHRIAERETAKQALADAAARLNHADDLYDIAASAVENTFGALRQLVAEAREASLS